MLSVLYTLAENIRKISIMLQPFMPESSSKILTLLTVPEDQRSFKHLAENYALKSGTPLPVPTPVFPRFIEKAA